MAKYNSKNISIKRKKFLEKKANFIRKDTVRVAVRNGAGHIASSLSCVEILTALYYECMSYDVKNPLSEDRDRLVFSKAHGCYSLYAILADIGFLPKKEWENFCKQDSVLTGCVERRLEYGLEAGCGSLGHGLPISVGLAFGAKIQARRYHVFCVVSDGELQEGVNWESLQFAVKHEISNLTVIIDRNRLQAIDFIVNILDRKEGDMIRRLKGFGLLPRVCPGHDIEKLVSCINSYKRRKRNIPEVIIAKTVKGFGLNCMENIPKFHFRLPTEEELAMGGRT